jgi:hypothetical protein
LNARLTGRRLAAYRLDGRRLALESRCDTVLDVLKPRSLFQIVRVEVITKYQTGEIALWVGVDQQDPMTLLGEHPSYVVDGRGFADATLVVE